MTRLIERPMLAEVFKPITLNRLSLPNRILMSSMHLNLDEYEDAYERMASFYALRARGGVGIIVTAGCSPNHEGKGILEGFALDGDELVAKHAAVVEAVHREGGRIAMQMMHFGREACHGKLVSASALRLRSNFFTPRALTEAEIEQTIEDHATCAARAVQANYDAVELLFSQGYLVHQFLAPRTNQRQDRWGGSFENRARFAIAVAQKVRDRVGPDYPLIFRLPCYDLIEGGITTHESLELIRRLEHFGIDLLNVSIGWHHSPTPTIAMDVPRAAFAEVARSIKGHFPQLKVAVSNRINDLRVGEELLRVGGADMIAMARPLLADPFLIEKSARNAFDEINTCIACNQRCLDYVFRGKTVGCSVAPDSMTPGEAQFVPFSRPMKLAVVGGGLAGLGAALFLRKRGAEVTVYEAEMRLGGQLRLAERIPGKAEFHETIRYYEHELYRLGVKVQLNTPFTEDFLSQNLYDHIVFAHGSVPRVRPDLADADLPVVSYVDVIAGAYPITFPLVIIGGGGVACDTAKYVYQQAQAKAQERRAWYPQAGSVADPAITLLQRSSQKIAHRVGKTTRWIMVKKLAEMGVKIRTAVDVVTIRSDGVEVYDRGAHQSDLIPATMVIVAAGQIPRPLPVPLARLGSIPYSVIGAASVDDTPANLTTALGDAYQLAMALQ